jgi:hypothetical protein
VVDPASVEPEQAQTRNIDKTADEDRYMERAYTKCPREDNDHLSGIVARLSS